MENDIKQHTLVFDKGITSVPSDLLCPDDTLETCDGMTLINGEWKAIQKPKEVKTLTGKLMYVHKGSDYTHYIYLSESGLLWIDDENVSGNIDTSLSSVVEIASIGNTLIVNTDNGHFYYLWKGSSYKSLGSNLPNLNIDFSLSTQTYTYLSDDEDGYTDVSAWIEKISDGFFGRKDGYDKESWNNYVIGSYSKCKKNAAEKGYFTNPFFVRVAYELYDGTYARIGEPVLMYPCIHKNCAGLLSTLSKPCMKVRIPASHLYAVNANTISDEWSDILKSIAIFVTDDVDVNDTNTESLPFTKETGYNYDFIDGLGAFSTGDIRRNTGNVSYQLLYAKSDNDFNDELIKERSVFYKIGNMELSDLSWSSFNVRKNTLVNLTTQPTLVSETTHEDYYGNCNITNGKIYTFNRRLNIIGAKRDYYKGSVSMFKYRSNSYVANTQRDYKIRLVFNDGEEHIQSFSTNNILCGSWYFYPDTRAKKIYVYCKLDGTYKLSFEHDLVEHSGLNGSYCFVGRPNGSEQITTSGDAYTAEDKYHSPDILDNYVIQSEVDNPFVFNASGYVRVGQGEIIGLSGLTTALSQDAYKVATTIAFTTQGIWAMKIDAVGQYAEVPPPFSREVCKNADSIKMVDNAVFFVGEKGLMCITGTTENGVVCVSSQLHDNKTFHNFLEHCKIAYDYTDSMLLLFNNNSANGWAYNISSSMWSEIKGLIGSASNFKTVVGDYPDDLIQGYDNKVYSLVKEPYRTDDVNTYNGVMTSRAMKFEGSLILKSIRQIKHLKLLNNGTFGFKMYATNDLLEPTTEGVDKWHELSSVRGKAWRFFRFKYTFTNIKAVDSFAGTIVTTQQKHKDKLR